MGRPSMMDVRTQKGNGAVANLRIGGECVLVSERLIEVEQGHRAYGCRRADA